MKTSTTTPPAMAAQREGATATLARHVLQTAWRTLPSGTQLSTKRLLLDGIGCLLAGTRGGPGAIVARATAQLSNGNGDASVVIDGSKASARDAAFVNGITLYSVGVNDIHKPSGSHPGGCIIPAVLAAGEWLQSPGEDMLAAMVAGYDVMGRLGRATLPSHRERGFHPTGTFGTFGATAAVARLMKLDHTQCCNALGIAGSQAAGVKAFQTDGSLTMIFHAGRAAQNGVEAALLAREGFTGPKTVFEDEKGFVKATTDVFRMHDLTADLGSLFDVDATSFRPYYGCTLTITGSGATAAIMRRSKKRLADVASVAVRSNPVVEEEVGNDDPRTLLAARLSMQFNIALVIDRGDVLVGDVTEEDLWNAPLRGLMPRVVFELDAAMPRYGAVVTVHFKDGTSDTESMLSPKGDPENQLSWDEIRHKFMALVAPLGDSEGASRVADLVLDLENTNGPALVAAIDAVARKSRMQTPSPEATGSVAAVRPSKEIP